MDWKDIINEHETLDESSFAMFAIKGIMDKWKRTQSKTEKEKMAKDLKDHESKLTKSPYWKTATIKKDYDKFKEENRELLGA